MEFMVVCIWATWTPIIVDRLRSEQEDINTAYSEEAVAL